jgi:ATP-dependent protease HslVU peptidase subunit
MDMRQKLLPIFISEAEKNLKILKRYLLQGDVLIGDPDDLEVAFRAAHTIKGTSQLVEAHAIHRIARRLEALLAVADADHLFLVSGDGNVIEPDDDIVAVGSGGPYALAAARALKENGDLDAQAIVRRSLEIAADICIYTNRSITVLELDATEK